MRGVVDNFIPSGMPSLTKALRALAWLIALALGAAGAWIKRFTTNPDGVFLS
jgi:hypothetical protein